MRIFFLTNGLPFGRRNGGEICTDRLIGRLLELGTSVLVIGRGDVSAVPKVNGLEVVSLGDRPTEFALMPINQRVISLIGALAAGESWTAHRMSQAMSVELRKMKAALIKCECGFIDHLQMYKLYRDLGLNVPAIVVSHNVESRLYGELSRSAASAAARWILTREQVFLERMEQQVVGRVAGVACVTEAERQYYVELSRRMRANVDVECLPSYFDCKWGGNGDASVRKPRHGGPRIVGIVGTWTWESNRMGIEWFLTKVLPLIGESVEVRIAGQGLSMQGLPPKVKYLGFVDSISAFYEDVDLIAIPSVAGAGIQEKTVEALSYGLPIVATDTAVRGLDPLPGYVTVANSPADFALACSDKVMHDAESIYAAGMAWNSNRYKEYGMAIGRLLSAAAAQQRS